ncbi:NTP transferase domain-containing protein [Candidatus Peregrinibacteria bacterium]|nr:NTP transferase domain-containing protein [Candidatus Peregrinibacteria bacterium]MBI3816510.1 NTP transferase domain-containing protein [Candidatus Peregrinibacteria bacterium]
MKLTQAVLPVAGLGTRFLPWTKVVPKELLPLGNQPIIAHLVDECLSVGITDICFVISKGKEAIPQYFAPHPEFEEELRKRGKLDALSELQKYDAVRFHVVHQDEQKGDGHAILQANDWISADVVAVLFGDDLILHDENGLQQLLRAYEDVAEKHPEETPALLSLENVPAHLVSKYGIVEIDDARSIGTIRRIRGMVEKPHPSKAPSTLGIIGKYLIPRSTIQKLPAIEGGHGGEIRLIDALTSQLGEVPIYGVEMRGKRLDTGTPEGYKEAVRMLG